MLVVVILEKHNGLCDYGAAQARPKSMGQVFRKGRLGLKLELKL